VPRENRCGRGSITTRSSKSKKVIISTINVIRHVAHYALIVFYAIYRCCLGVEAEFKHSTNETVAHFHQCGSGKVARQSPL
jgi:hypothetical protein